MTGMAGPDRRWRLTRWGGYVEKTIDLILRHDAFAALSVFHITTISAVEGAVRVLES